MQSEMIKGNYGPSEFNRKIFAVHSARVLSHKSFNEVTEVPRMGVVVVSVQFALATCCIIISVSYTQEFQNTKQ